MSVMSRTNRRIGSHSFLSAGGQIGAASVYLTDEVFLYRVAGWTVSGADEIVELEDCYQLDVVAVPMRNLLPRRLRVVTPSTADG
jgi:hypothetical protein